MKEIYLPYETVISKSLRSLTTKDPFREFRWKGTERLPLHSQQTESFYLLKTRNRFEAVLRYWKMTDIFKGLNPRLEAALWNVPGIDRDVLYWSLKRAKNLILHQNEEWDLTGSETRQSIPQPLLERLQRLQSKLGLPLWSWNFLYASENQFRYELHLVIRETRKVKKYSGYVRTPSAVGSKRKTSILEMEDLDEMESISRIEEDDFLEFFLSPTEDYSLLGDFLEAKSAHFNWTSPEKEGQHIYQLIKLHLGYQGPGALFV